MTCLLLPNSMFDDGSIECRTFCLVWVDACNEENIRTFNDFDVFKVVCAKDLPAIRQAVSEGKHHLTLYNEEGRVREYQWD